MVTFRAMNTDVSILAPGLDKASRAGLVQRIEELFAACERRFSRFRPDSELERLNRAAGPVVVSAPMFDALKRARRYAELTGWVFDPTIGPSLAAAGYDRSFAPGRLDREEGAGPLPPRASLREVVLDEATRTVFRPAHVGLDFGGFLKGWAVDRAAELLPRSGAVDAGGDAAARGDAPDGEGWLVDVEDPFDAEGAVLTLRLRDRAVATSAPNRRRWRAGGRERHHLMNPRTREPALSDLAQATVVAGTAELCDVLAKAVFVLGSEGGRRLLEGLPGAGGVLVTRSGEVRAVGEVEVWNA